MQMSKGVKKSIFVGIKSFLESLSDRRPFFWGIKFSFKLNKRNSLTDFYHKECKMSDIVVNSFERQIDDRWEEK